MKLLEGLIGLLADHPLAVIGGAFLCCLAGAVAGALIPEATLYCCPDGEDPS